VLGQHNGRKTHDSATIRVTVLKGISVDRTRKPNPQSSSPRPSEPTLRLETGAGRSRADAPAGGDFDLSPPLDYVVAEWIRYKQRLETLPRDDANVAKALGNADRMIAFLSAMQD